MDFVEIARFPSRLEAETIGHALDAHDIPFLVQSEDLGVFGPGMTGMTPDGAALLVPADRVEEVRGLITCVVRPLTEDELAAIPELAPSEDDASQDDETP